MTWTYTPPAPDEEDVLVFASDVSWVRYRVGDTVQSIYSLSDEEIGFEIAQDDPKDLWLAASRVASQMGTRYTSAATAESKTVGKVSLSKSYSDSAARYAALALRLAARATGNSGRRMPGMGLVSQPPLAGMFSTRQFE